MDNNKLTDRLNLEIRYEQDRPDLHDEISWRYQHGIIISVNEAKLFVDLLKKEQS